MDIGLAFFLGLVIGALIVTIGNKRFFPTPPNSQTEEPPTEV